MRVFSLSPLLLTLNIIGAAYDSENVSVQLIPTLKELATRALIAHPEQMAHGIEYVHNKLYDDSHLLAVSINEALHARLRPAEYQHRGFIHIAVNSIIHRKTYMAFNHDGSLLALGSGRLSDTQSCPVILLNPKTEKIERVFHDNPHVITSLSFSPDGPLLAVGSWDLPVRIWHVKTGELAQILHGHTASATYVAFSPDNITLASGSNDNTVRIWNTQTGQTLHLFEGTNVIHALTFNHDGTQLAYATGLTIYMRNPLTGELLWQESSYRPEHKFSSLAFSPDDNTLAAGCYFSVQLRNPKSGRFIGNHGGLKDDVFSLSYSPDGKTIATVSRPPQGARGFYTSAHLVDVDLRRRATPKPLSFDDSITAALYSPDGALLAVIGNTHKAVWLLRLDYIRDMLTVTDIEEQRFLLHAAQDWLAGKTHATDILNPIYQEIIKRFAYLDDERLFSIEDSAEEQDPKSSCDQALRTAITAGIIGVGLYVSSWFI